MGWGRSDQSPRLGDVPTSRACGRYRETGWERLYPLHTAFSAATVLDGHPSAISRFADDLSAVRRGKTYRFPELPESLHEVSPCQILIKEQVDSFQGNGHISFYLAAQNRYDTPIDTTG